ncbi:MAG: acetyl-CoA carboxylase, biotin carboxyl carrier protein, partial [Holosporales bacterium]|nr:acetyl-CoA carboxylase, biotin carboxyl carrier protein [Holosporales bacterium]
PPFVTPGASVQEGQTLLIVEAMKVMNPVRAPRTGTIKEICIENAAPVEFGETLLYILA